VADFGSLGVIVRHQPTFGLLALIGSCLITSGGCISSKNFNALGDAIAETIVTKMLVPQMELAASTIAFQRMNERWPSDYAELRSFTATEGGSTLTNYDKVEFIQKADGSLEICAIAPGMTNRMILGLPDESRK
jgi:hypothetical protein